MIERQRELLERVAQLLHAEAEENYDSLECDFSFSAASVGMRFSFKRDGKEHSQALSLESALGCSDLILELHKMMKEHMKGVWSSMTLKIDENGVLNTDFTYQGQ